MHLRGEFRKPPSPKGDRKYVDAEKSTPAMSAYRKAGAFL